MHLVGKTFECRSTHSSSNFSLIWIEFHTKITFQRTQDFVADQQALNLFIIMKCLPNAMKIQFLINWHEDLLAAIYDRLFGLSSLAQWDPKDLQTCNLHSKNDGLKADWYCKNSKLAVDDVFSNQTLELEEEEDLHRSRIASCFKSVDCWCSYVYKQSHGTKQDNPS